LFYNYENTYNSEKYLQECIESIIAQKLDINEYEHIFVDAYSTDNTKKIINEYAKKYLNVKLIERKPKWVYNAMNEGIKESHWKYILCLNSDDWLEPEVLNDYLQYIKKTKEKDLYYWDITFREGNNFKKSECSKRINKLLFKIWWFHCLIWHPSVLIKKTTFYELWMFDESKKIASDYGFRLNILKNNKEYIYYPKLVANFRVHDWWISSNLKNKKISNDECDYFIKTYLPRYKKIARRLILLYRSFKKLFK